jgi:hypothetical protein
LFVPDCRLPTNSMFTRRQCRLGSRDRPKVEGLILVTTHAASRRLDATCLADIRLFAPTYALFAFEIYVMPQNPAPSDLCASASFHYHNFTSPWTVEERPRSISVSRRLAPYDGGHKHARHKHEENYRCDTHGIDRELQNMIELYALR